MRALLFLLSAYTIAFAGFICEAEAQPLAIIGDCVNAITGHYFICQEDLVADGPQPIGVIRSFYGSVQTKPESYQLKLNGGWTWFQHTKAVYEADGEYGAAYYVYEPNGTLLVFSFDRENYLRSHKIYPSKKYLSKAYANTNRGSICGRNDLSNYYIEPLEHGFRLHCADGTARYYRYAGDLQIGKGKAYLLLDEQHPSSRKTRYEYNISFDNPKKFPYGPSASFTNNLKRIWTTDYFCQQTYASMDFTYEIEGRNFKGFKITTHDGKWASYRFIGLHDMDKKFWDKLFAYRKTIPAYLLTSVESSEFPTEHLEYRCKNLKIDPLLIKRSWPDGRFKKINYVNDKSFRVQSLESPWGGGVASTIAIAYGEGCCKAYDACGNHTLYEYTPEKRLRSISVFDSQQKRLKTTSFAWQGHRIKSVTTDSSKTIYEYDSRGNAVCEKIRGNLTSTGVDVAVTKRTYSNDRFNLLSQEIAPNGLITNYTYSYDFITSKEIIGDGIHQQEIFTYDSLYNLIEKTQQEQTTRYSYNKRGLPISIDEQGKKTQLTYNNRGQVKTKKIFDTDGNFAYAVHNGYDGRGRLIEQTDPIGNKTQYAYDVNDNQIRLKSPGSAIIHNTFDALNHLIKQKQGGHISKFGYDKRHNAVFSLDYLGATTHHKYDALNRCIKTTYPSGYSEQRTYDPDGNITKVTNAHGGITQTHYTAYGKPFRIIYPDGEQETFAYDLLGNLICHKNQAGMATHYQYDQLGRLTKKTTQGKTEQWDYDSYRLIRYMDPEEIETHYSYDAYGRKICETRGTHKTSWEYDTLGRQHKTELHNEENTHISTTKFDLCDRPIEERTNTLKTQYAYDKAGNRILVRRWIDSAETTEHFTYDLYGREMSYTDQEGHVTKKHYTISDKTLCKTTTGPTDIITKDHYNPQEQLIKSQRFHSNQLIHSDTYNRNHDGQIKEHISLVINPDFSSHLIKTVYQYDTTGRQIALIEPQNRITRNTYTSTGQIATIQKPDSVQIDHTYDLHDRLIRLHSSDGTIDYTYTYDNLDQITSVIDHIHDLTTTRSWDSYGNLLKETLANGLTLSSTYDAADNRTSFTYPDNQQATFEYKNTQLKTIRYKDYEHTYTNYDQSGNILSQTSSNNLADATLTYTKRNLPQSISSAYYTHTINSYCPLGNILSATQTCSNNAIPESYTYDPYNHLTSENYHDNTYSYDSLGNRLSQNGDAYTINDLNQILASPNATYTYDPNGNPTTCTNASGTTTLIYDALGRLTKIEAPSFTHHYTYDYLNRRIQADEILYIYDDQNELGSVKDGLIQERRILGIGQGAEIGAAIAIELNDQLYVPLHDLYGNVAILLDQNAEIYESYTYDAFGNHSSGTNPWRYQSKRHDPTGLINFGRRYYDPTIGRFLTTDPLGLSEGPNLYRFVSNNPLIFYDLYGLADVDPMTSCSNTYIHGNMNAFINAQAAFSVLTSGSFSAFSITQKSLRARYGFLLDEKYPINDTWNDRFEVKTTEYLIYAGAAAGIYGAISAMIPTATSAVTASATAGSATSALITTETALTTAGTTSLAVQESAVTTALVSTIGSQIANTASTLQMSQSTTKNQLTNVQLETLLNQAQDYLGQDVRVIINKAGDPIFLSKDGMRCIRFDFNSTKPHNNLHMHVERKVGDTWIKSGPIYPIDVPHN